MNETNQMNQTNQINQINKLSRYSRSLGFTAALLLCTGIATAPAMAASVPITFTFTGKVTYVGYEMGEHFVDGLGQRGPFRLDKSVTGSYTFNPDTSNSGSGTTGTYNGALNGSSTNLHVVIGTATGTYEAALLSSGANKIEVKNPSGDGSIDESYKVEGKFSGDRVTSHDPGSFKLEFVNSSSNQFEDLSLPFTPPTISDFAKAQFRLVFEHQQSPDRHTVLVKLETLTAVPLPPAVILFGAGLVALIGLGARSRKRAGT